MLTLRSYQEELITKALGQRATYLALSMRLGKSAIALKVAEKMGGRCVIVVPAYLKSQWQDEALKWTPKLNPEIVSYGMLQKVRAGTIHTLIADEGHYLKSIDSLRTERFYQIATNANKILLLSGTPVTRESDDLFSQLAVMGHYPLKRGDYWRFCHAYLNVKQGRFGQEARGVKDKEAFGLMLHKCGVIELKRSDVIAELPQWLESTVEVDTAHPDIRALLDSMITQGELEAEATIHNARRNEGRLLAPSVGEAVQGLKSVIFTWYKDTVEHVSKACEKNDVIPFRCTGEIQDRGSVIKQWSDCDKPCALVATIASTSLGVDLSASVDCFFAQSSYSPFVNEQARARLLRIGKTDPISVTNIVIKGGLESLILKKLAQREKRNEMSGSFREILLDEIYSY